jgi:diacylglycerol kinase family enzyme
VAALVADSRVALGILPLGTLNHFARDAGIPADLGEAARAIVAGHTMAVDIADVNGRVFVNNSSVGLYPLMVRDREHQQEHLGRSKWPAMARAAGRAVWRFSKWRLRITVEGDTEIVETPILFVGNNRYETSLFALGRRARLDEGQLFFYAVHARSRLGLAKAMLRALFGRLDQARDFVVIGGTEARVEGRRKLLPVATDGEALALETPLHYRVRPKALKLLVPLASAAQPS